MSLTAPPRHPDRSKERVPWGLVGLLGGCLAAAALLMVLPSGWASDALTWVRTAQAEYQRALTDAVRALREDHLVTAALSLGGLSFLYGVLHAVGPGHGKAVIGTYAATNLRQVRRAVMLSFGAGLVQAVSAIVLVSVAFLVIAGGTRWAAQAGERYLEPASYALIAALGVWVAGRSAWPWLGRLSGRAHAHGGEPHAHDHACGCGHDHVPTASQVAAAGSWRQIAALSFAVGLRPCTGAILVLVLSFSLGLWAAGVAAALFMGLGTAITVSVLAVLASTIGKAAVPGQSAARGLWPRLLGVAGGGLILALGLTLFLAAIQRPAHPLL